MQHKFEVTGLGIQIDGRMVMPGSTLYLKSAAPAHWQRFGEASTGEEKPKPKEFEVATPEPSKRRGRPRKDAD